MSMNNHNYHVIEKLYIQKFGTNNDIQHDNQYIEVVRYFPKKARS